MPTSGQLNEQLSGAALLRQAWDNGCPQAGCHLAELHYRPQGEIARCIERYTDDLVSAGHIDDLVTDDLVKR